jgi:hypothetical protein
LEAEEKKVHGLTQKLNSSLEALISKEAMANQHAKVAEEAVAGSLSASILLSCRFENPRKERTQERNHSHETLKFCLFSGWEASKP